MRVRLKNKGSKKRPSHQRQKYQTPVPEHPQTAHSIAEKEIHANHLEAFNASMRLLHFGAKPTPTLNQWRTCKERLMCFG